MRYSPTTYFAKQELRIAAGSLIEMVLKPDGKFVIAINGRELDHDARPVGTMLGGMIYNVD